MTLDVAIKRRLSVMPCQLDKKPFFRLLPKDERGNRTWAPFQIRLATPDEIRAWIKAKPPAWAIVTGTISGRVTIDFDGEAGRQLAEKWDVRQTPSGGGHLDVVHPGFHIPVLNGKTKKELGQH